MRWRVGLFSDGESYTDSPFYPSFTAIETSKRKKS